MDIYPLIKTLFSTPVWIVLDYLLQNPDSKNTDAEISRLVKGVKKSAVNAALRKLAEVDITSRQQRGRSIFNKLMESPLITQLKITSNLIHIQPFVDQITPNCSKIVLFGSRAEGVHNSESDFDIFIVATDLNRLFINSKLSDDVQLVLKTPEQMLTFDKDEPTLSKEVKKGIVLWEKT